MKKFEHILDRIIAIISIISYAGFFLIMVFTIADVFMRSVFSKPILGSYEIVEQIIFCAVFASFAYAQTQKAHIHITMLTSLFPFRLRSAVTALTYLLSAGVVFAIAYAASVQAGVAQSSQYTTGVLRIPVYPMYWVECITMAAFGLILLVDAIKNLGAVFCESMARSLKAELNG